MSHTMPEPHYGQPMTGENPMNVQQYINPVGEAPVQQAPVQQAPVQQAPVQQYTAPAPVQNAPEMVQHKYQLCRILQLMMFRFKQLLQ